MRSTSAVRRFLAPLITVSLAVVAPPATAAPVGVGGSGPDSQACAIQAIAYESLGGGTAKGVIGCATGTGYIHGTITACVQSLLARNLGIPDLPLFRNDACRSKGFDSNGTAAQVSTPEEVTAQAGCGHRVGEFFRAYAYAIYTTNTGTEIVDAGSELHAWLC